MNWLQLLVSACFLLFGIYGIFSTYRLDQKGHKQMIKDPYSSFFTLMPLWLAKLTLYVLCLIPIAATVAMWLQTYGIIE